MSRMQAVVHHEYGAPTEVLSIEETDVPDTGRNDLLVRVRATAVSPGDLFITRGYPYMLRLMTGLVRPKPGVLGLVVSGTVAEVGRDVARFRPGDDVVAEVPRGGFAEYAAVPEKRAALKPASLGFEEAAAVPLAGVTALQALRDVARVEPGQRVLVNGASGGVGTFAVQIAKEFGAHVTGVCGPSNLDLVAELGADEVIDYTKQDFTRSGKLWDVVLDNVGNHPLSALRRVVRRGGVVIPSANSDGRWLGGGTRAIQALVMSPFVPQRLRPFLARAKAEDLVVLNELIEAGAVSPVIDRTYPLAEAPEAIDYYSTGHARGKVVITI